MSEMLRTLGQTRDHVDALSDTDRELLVDRCNLIINYLPHDMDDAGLTALFADVGEVVAAKVVRDKNTKKNLGYGFVKYIDEATAEKAIELKNGISIGSKKLKVSIARPQSEDIKNCKIYVTNLPKSYTEKDIRQLFSTVNSISIPY